MAVLTLPEFDIVDIECPAVYGIVSPSRFLKLAYAIDKSADFCSEEIDLFTTEDASSHHAIYKISHLDADVTSYLLKNKGNGGYLLSQFKQVDCILCSNQVDFENKILLNQLNRMPDISICFKIDSISTQEKLTFAQFI